MKNTFFFFIVIFLVTYKSYSQIPDSTKNYKSVMSLIKKGLNNNFDTIKQISNDLTQSQKLSIYKYGNKPWFQPLILNIFPGLGIGSWLQGDILGGSIGTIGEGVGYYLLITSMKTDHFIVNKAFSGIYICLGTKIIETIFPFTFANSYNSRLEKALGMNSITGCNITPNLYLAKNNNLIPGLKLQVCF